MISGFELAGLVGTLDASINVTTRIVTILRDFKNFDDDEISIADSFQRLSFALKNFQKALKTLAEDPRSGDADMREDLAALVTGQSPRLAALQSRLSEKVATMEKWKKGGNLTSRGVWAVWRKREMEKLQRDLAEWVNHFHLAYISIEAAENTQTPRHNNSNDTLIFGRILNLFRDEKFQSALPLDRSHLPWAKDDVKVIQETTAFALVEVKDKKQAIAEFVPYSKNLNNAEIEKLAKQLENTAQALCQADPQQTRILTCIGYYHDTDSCRLGLLYEIPIGYRTLVENEKPVLRTLHDIWGNKPPTHSLDQRVRLTRDISTAILYIHAVGWVHKDVCPQNIIVLEESGITEEDNSVWATFRRHSSWASTQHAVTWRPHI
jgi:hypothetical protein